jgi:hypothetical protein
MELHFSGFGLYQESRAERAFFCIESPARWQISGMMSSKLLAATNYGDVFLFHPVRSTSTSFRRQAYLCQLADLELVMILPSLLSFREP